MASTEAMSEISRNRSYAGRNLADHASGSFPPPFASSRSRHVSSKAGEMANRLFSRSSVDTSKRNAITQIQR